MVNVITQAWEHRALILATILVGVTAFMARCVQDNIRLRQMLADKPKVETKVETRVETKIVQGPERIVERVVKGEVVERVVYRDPVTTQTVKDKASEQVEKPFCPPEKNSPARFVGVLLPPTGDPADMIVHGGVTLGGRLDLGYGFQPHGGIHRLEGNWRF